MVNQQVLDGHWNEIQGKIRDRWGQLTDDELRQFDGNVEQLVGMIQRKTGEAQEEIQAFLDEITSGSAVHQAGEKVKEYARHAAENASGYVASAGESIREGAHSVTDSAKAGYIQTERLVRRRPVESLAVCFGAGLITGVVVGLVLRSR